MNKLNLNKLRIKNKRDWGIFWIFTALICYGLSSRLLTYGLQNRMFDYANPYMTNLNDPSAGWGRLLITLLLLDLVAEAVLFLCKGIRRKIAAMTAVLAAAILMPFLTFGMYKVHTDLIVSSLWKEEPQSVSIWPETDPVTGKRGTGLRNEDLSEEQKSELLELCRNLTVISDEEELQRLEDWYCENNDAFMNASNIYLHFGKKYGHSYSFILRIYEGKVFIWRGNGKQSRQYLTFFENNGITEWVEEILQSAESQ